MAFLCELVALLVEDSERIQEVLIDVIEHIREGTRAMFGGSMPREIIIAYLLVLTFKFVFSGIKKALVEDGKHPLFIVNGDVFDKVHREYFLLLALRCFLSVSIEKHIHVLLKERHRSFQLFFDHEIGYIRLGPKQWESAPDLSI